MYARLDSVYEREPRDSSYLSGSKKHLYALTKTAGKRQITQPIIQKYLLEKEPYTLHRRVIHNFKRNHYFTTNVYELYEADLIDLSAYASQNDGNKFILTIIDTFSKFAFVKVLKNKNASSVCKAFREVLDESGHNPKAIQTDRGLEFKNKIFKSLLNSRKIKQNFPVTPSPFKASIVEIFNRTLKTKIFRYFTHLNKKNYRRYVDVIDDIVHSYNGTVHSATLMKPKDVNALNAPMVYRNIHRRHRRRERHVYLPQILQKGEYVRVALKKRPLDAGIFKELWSKEFFIVDKVINKIPYKLYKIRDMNDREVDGKFYFEQLQKIILPKKTIVKVLKRQGLGINAKKYVLYASGEKKWIN